LPLSIVRIRIKDKYDKFKISLSLGSDKLYISALDEVTYDFYDLDITNMIFNNDNIKLSQLFTIIKEGFQQANQNNKISITLSNKFVTIGITGTVCDCNYNCNSNYYKANSSLTHKSHYDLIESFQERSNHVTSFMNQFNPNLHYNVIELKDNYGPTITDQSIQAIICSKETIDNCYKSKIFLIILKTFMINLISK
jgi:hypothetical protein